jgi:hypothetical protein
MRPVVALSLASMVGACELAVSLDGLIGGGQGDSPSDSGHEAFAAAGEAGITTDATPAPAVPDDDGALPDDAGGAPLSTCVGVDAYFCASFDDDAALPAGFSALQAFNGALGSLDSDKALSPPRSFLAALPSHDAARTEVRLARRFKGTPSRFVFAFDAFFDDPRDAGSFEYGGIEFHGSMYYEALLRTGGAGLREYADPTAALPTLGVSHPLTKLPKAGAWVHVELEFSIEAERSSAIVRFDGEVVLPETPLSAHVYASDLEIGIGIQSVGAAPAYSARFDNVRVTIP